MKKKWKYLIVNSYKYTKEELINCYDSLYLIGNNKPFFLYNYGSVLRKLGEYEQSIKILNNCEEYFSDYDVKILLANNYYDTDSLEKALKCYNDASFMCPNRFTPLYKSLLIYEKLHNSIMIEKMCKVMIEKEVKIPSKTISQIQLYARKKIIEEQNSPNFQMK